MLDFASPTGLFDIKIWFNWRPMNANEWYYLQKKPLFKFLVPNSKNVGHTFFQLYKFSYCFFAFFLG